MLFVPCMSMKLLSTSWPNTMHIRIRYIQAKFRRVSVTTTAIIILSADNTTDQKHRY